MLLILRNAQKRETEASLPCEKNTLLAITILLSAAPKVLTDGDPLVARFAKELCDCIDSPMTSRVAAGCARTLLLSSVASAQLIQHAITFLTQPSDLEGLDESRSVTAQTLTMYAGKLPSSSKQQGAAVALFMAVLLQRARAEGGKTHPDTAARLLDLAAVDNVSFRAVVTRMEREEKQFLERILKSRAVGSQKGQDLDDQREPTIALKMSFGG